ncbi:MAG: AAA family ATPase, partial [Acidimicrobiales bacterium]
MLLTRLYLRNFRVYEDELELALPPGLVGVYGPNGAGKSTLLEAILFTLWGRARTPKEEIRSAGVRADCVTELEFEHEGHLYLARRTLSGINSSVRAQAHCDGLIMSEGVRDTARYLHSVLGMDDAAFRASVFAEQKQLAAFSSQSPADRRRLVLQLLGITPLDAARDMARKDARERASEHERLSAMLPDVAAREVAAADADVAARAAEALSAREEQAAEAARALVDRTAATLADLDCLRQRHEALMIEGRATRGELELAQAEVGSLSEELEALRGAAAELEHLEPLAALAGVTEARLLALSNAPDAARAAASISMPDPPEPFDEVAHECAVDAAEAARTALASLQGRHQAALAELERARRQAESSRSLSGEGACPLCGQALGTAFEEVRRHRAEEVAEAERRLGALATEEKRAAAAAEAALSMLRRSEEARRRAQAAQQGWEQAVTRRGEAEAALVKAWASPETGGPAPAATPSAVAELERLVEATRLDMASQRAAAASAQTLRGRLERRGAVEESLAAALRRTEAAEVRRRELLDQLAALAYDASALEAARQAHAHASAAAEEAA